MRDAEDGKGQSFSDTSVVRSMRFFDRGSGDHGYWREPRTFRSDPPVTAALERLRFMPVPVAGAPPEVYFALGRPFENGAYDLSQGKRLYSWFGCPACHGEGEGGKGPSFLDGQWIYGPSMVSVAASIRDGRPHGMPQDDD